jgi:rubrerythrin
MMLGSFVWRRRQRTVQTLLGFARTEAGGAVDIARAAAATTTPELRRHLLRHAADEARHAEMFRRRAREVFGSSNLPLPESGGIDLAPAASATERGRLSLTDHGFLPSDCFAELGEVRYVAMLHLAELEAAEDFRIHRRLTQRSDPETSAVFADILHDERYHVAYTRAQLRSWEKQGRGREVRRARRAMRWVRLRIRWTQLGQRVGDVLGYAMLGGVYLTLFAPFGLLATLLPRRLGWTTGRRTPAGTLAELRQQA